MYKILIAETDEETIETITKIIEQKIKEAKVVACARSGNEALLKTINDEPDLIIMAVRIAGLNGIETIRQIRKINERVHIIIVSAYDYFEFAKEAMLLNVGNYLLKPIKTSDLVQAIKKELQKIKGEEEQEKRFRKEEVLLNDSLRFVEHSFIYSIIFNGKYEVDCKQYREILDIEEYGYVMGIEIAPSFMESYWDLDRAMERIHSRIKQIVSSKEKCVVGPKLMNRIMVYVSNRCGKDSKEEQQEAVKTAKLLIRGLKETFELETYVGIGTTKSMSKVHESYEEALCSLRYKSEGPVVCYKEIRHKSTLYFDYVELTQDLLEDIKYGRHNAPMIFDAVIETLKPYPKEERLSKLMEVLLLVNAEARKDGQSKIVDYLGDMNELMQLSETEQERWAQTRFHSILKSFETNKSDRKSNIINAATEYIQRHYNRDISLNEISQYVNLSPQHFSKIFKETTNSNYVEWLANVRITKAKELMNNSDKTIKEICYLVGYQDPNYFSRIFKKYVGVSPTEYLKERQV